MSGVKSVKLIFRLIEPLRWFKCFTIVSTSRLPKSSVMKKGRTEKYTQKLRCGIYSGRAARTKLQPVITEGKYSASQVIQRLMH